MKYTSTLFHCMRKKGISLLLSFFLILSGVSDMYATVTVTIPSVPGTDTSSFMPTNRRYTYSASRMLFSSSEVGTTGTITKVAFEKDTGSTSVTVNYISIYMRETTTSSLTTSAPSLGTGYKLVYYSSYLVNTMSSGWTEVTLSTSPGDIMTYSGGSNYLEIVVVKEASETAVTTFPNYPVYNCHTTTGTMAAYYYGSSKLSTSSSTTYTATSTKRPNVQLTFDNTCAGKPAAGVVTGPSSAVCSADGFSLYGVGLTLGTGMKYQWQSRNAGSSSAFTNTAVADTNTSLNTSTTVNKEYRVYSLCSLSGQSDTSAPITINVVPVPTVSATGSITFCDGGGVTLTTPTTSGITYTWYNGTTSTGTTGGTYNATTPGTYKVVASTGACPAVNSSNTKVVTVNPLPSAPITALSATTFCDGSDVVLQTSSSAGLSYQWRKGGVDIFAATSYQYTATTAGVYSVVVKNTSTGCEQTSSTISVTVNPMPAKPVLSTLMGDTSFCAGSSITISTPPTTGVSYQWENLSGTISGATSSSYNVTSPNTYTLKAILGSCIATSDPKKIIENPLPPTTITPSGTVSFCSGDSLEIVGPSGSGLKYEWKESGTAIPGATAVSYFAKTSGVYKVKVSYETTGCSDESATLTINIISPIVPTVSASGPTEFCTGGSVTLNGAISSGYTTQWQESSSDISGATASTFATSTAGTYRLKVTNGVGCVAYSTPIVVEVNPLPDNSLSITGGTDICNGTASVMLAPVVPGYTYQWRESGVDIAGATTNPYYAKTAGTYSVYIVDSNGCTAISTDVPVTVKFVTPFYIHPHGNTFFCDGEKTKLSTQEGFTSYQWYLDGVFIPGATDSFVYADTKGKYSVRVQDPVNGCFEESPGFNILVIPAPDTPFITQVGSRLSTSVRDVTYQWFKDGIAIPGATDSFIYTSGVGGIYAVEVTNLNDCSKKAELDLGTSGMTSLNASDMYVRVYPNPARDRVIIESPVPLKVMMYDLQGRLLLKQETDLPIDISQYTSGMYLLQFVDENNQVVGSQKISKID